MWRVVLRAHCGCDVNESDFREGHEEVIDVVPFLGPHVTWNTRGFYVSPGFQLILMVIILQISLSISNVGGNPVKPVFHWNLPLRRLIFAMLTRKKVHKQHEIYMKST